ncbi:hypothetical protein [Arcticibacter tournemirensis]
MNKERNWLLVIINVFLLLTSVSNLSIVFLAVLTHDVGGFVEILLILLLAAVAIVTAAINGYLLFNKDIRLIKITATLCFVEVFHVFTNGFFYKVANGPEYVVFLYEDKLGHLRLGKTFDPLNLEVMMKFKESDAMLYGVNVIPLALFVVLMYIIVRETRLNRVKLN